LCEADISSCILTRDLLHFRSSKLPLHSESNALISGVENYIQTNVHVNKSASSGVLGSRKIVNVVDAVNLDNARRSMKCSPKELATSKLVYHIDPSQSLGIKDLMSISHESRLRLVLNRRNNEVLQHSHAWDHLGLSIAPLPRWQTFPIQIERPLPSMNPMLRGVMERQKLLNFFFNMKHSSDLSNEREFDGELNNRNDHMLSELFPVKLHRLLQDLEQGRRGVNIAHFVPNGKAFVILDSHRFKTEVMKEYFPRMSSYASFQRQLNLYDFCQVHCGSSDRAYYHPSFLRDFPSLCHGMKRMKKKQNNCKLKG
jgi:HSF-type DNA-binding